ncbi:cyclopropane-fatty-acyl-phospholipid synthase [Folsomia candida]|nr:cyclopropane-fatty-acyl-phospholipid synthase [Folsomia candida]
MDLIRDVVYRVIVFSIRVYKYLEWLLIEYAEDFVEQHLNKIFKKAGIVLDGPKRYDPKINDKKEFYTRVVSNALLGLGEGYMEKIWDVEDLEEFAYQGLKHDLAKEYLGPVNKITNYMLLQAINLQTQKKSFEVGEQHYNLGNELFECMLDPTMQYSCGYWKDATNLEQAQLAKLNLIGEKLKLKPGMTVLDIGCGWGGLAKYLAENFGVSVVGCTISIEQAKLARERCEGLNVEIVVQDYRDIQEKFDRIVSVGMFEHVGPQNYPTFFEMTNRCLKDDGILLLHTIGVSHNNVPLTEPWFHKYIFRNAVLPYHTDIPKATDGLFILEDWHNMGHDYSLTLREWKKNFENNWEQLSMGKKVDEKFYRMWIYYLTISAACFRARKYQLWQIVMSKNGIEGGYQSVR